MQNHWSAYAATGAAKVTSRRIFALCGEMTGECRKSTMLHVGAAGMSDKRPACGLK